MNQQPAARQHCLHELSFESRTLPAKPWSDVFLTARFHSPAGRTLTVDGFYDGGRTWRVRFTPPSPGKWHFEIDCPQADTGMGGRRGEIFITPATTDPGSSPLERHGGILQVSTDHRYLTYTDGTPFFWLGDTWWFCPSALVPWDGSSRPGCDSTYRTLVDTRKAQGYSVVQMAFLGPMKESQGVNSFMKLREQTTFDVGYWQAVDHYISYANAAGIIPVIGLCFHKGLDGNTLEEWQFLWRYVVARYGAHSVSWLVSGEYNCEGADVPPDRVQKAMAIGKFIKSIDPYRRAMTIHPWWYAGEKRQAWTEPWYDFIMIQGGHHGPEKVVPAGVYLEAYRHHPPKPVLEGECNYEAIYAGQKREVTDTGVRRTAYWAFQSGSFGFTYGAHGLWYPNQNEADQTFIDWGQPRPWWEALSLPGGAQLAHLRSCYTMLDWWRLEPWPEAVRATTPAEEGHRPLAKGASDLTQVLVYFPPGYPASQAVKLQLPRRSETPYTATWFDPRKGQTMAVNHAVCPVAGEAVLPERPDDQDWALLLRCESVM